MVHDTLKRDTPMKAALLEYQAEAAERVARGGPLWPKTTLNGSHTRAYENTGSYTGDFVDGERHGRGVFEFDFFGRYEGEFKHNHMHGQGVMELTSGRRYEGEWLGSRQHGRGMYTWNVGLSAGCRHEGEYNDGLKHGRGVFSWPNGSRYEGEFCKDSRTGRGTYTWPTGAIYEGRFLEGLKHTATVPDGPKTVAQDDKAYFLSAPTDKAFVDEFGVTLSYTNESGLKIPVDVGRWSFQGSFANDKPKAGFLTEWGVDRMMGLMVVSISGIDSAHTRPRPLLRPHPLVHICTPIRWQSTRMHTHTSATPPLCSLSFSLCSLPCSFLFSSSFSFLLAFCARSLFLCVRSLVRSFRVFLFLPLYFHTYAQP